MKIRRVVSLRPAAARALAAVLFVAGATMGLGGTARAQFAFEDEVMPPRVVAWRLADRGFTGLSRPRFNGRVYVVEAVSPSGTPVRLFVDPAAGAIVGQQRLAAPESYARLERPAPGFGWTEEEAAPRRIVRPVSPEDGPALPPPHRPADQSVRPEGMPDGVNPRGSVRAAPARKVARAAPARQPDVKPAHRDSPVAPVPGIASLPGGGPAQAAKVDPGQGGAVDGKGDTKAAAIAPAPTTSAPAAETAPGTPPAAVTAEAKPTAPDWKDPPTDRKPVRVIGGAIVVPGASEKDAAAP